MSHLKLISKNDGQPTDDDVNLSLILQLLGQLLSQVTITKTIGKQ